MSANGHSRLSPSSASRWLRCPGSVNFLTDLDEEDSSGVPAAEGTILHSFCEDVLRTGRDAYSYVGEEREHDGYKYTLDEDTADLIQIYVDEIDIIPGKLFIERKVSLDRWMPDQGGTMDVGIVNAKHIHVRDWKWGYIPVSPVENEQMMLYALGFWDNIARHHSGATKFVLTIMQPRASGGGGEWETTLGQLREFGAEVKHKAALTYKEDAPRIPGPKQCQYCDGARLRLCDEYDQYNLNAIIEDFDEMDRDIEDGLPIRLTRRTITPERRSFIIENWPLISRWYERLHADAISDFLRGFPTPGHKVILGRNPPRKWHPEKKPEAEAQIENVLGEEAFSKKLITPTTAEKLLPPKQFAKLKNFIDAGEKKPVLVSEHDSNPAMGTVVDEFDD